jgi:hypothetical protein
MSGSLCVTSKVGSVIALDRITTTIALTPHPDRQRYHHVHRLQPRRRSQCFQKRRRASRFDAVIRSCRRLPSCRCRACADRKFRSRSASSEAEAAASGPLYRLEGEVRDREGDAGSAGAVYCRHSIYLLKMFEVASCRQGNGSHFFVLFVNYCALVVRDFLRTHFADGDFREREV